MNNEVVFAAAGNGKTYNICQEAFKYSAETKKCILLITYTNEGVRSLEQEYRKQNFGVIDNNVVIKTWYSFLLSELIKPYQCLLTLKYKRYKEELDITIPENYIKSIAFYQDEEMPRWYKSEHIQYYVNSAKDIRKDNVSHLAVRCIDDSENKVMKRLESIYSHIFVDELQDYAGWDLDIITSLFNSNILIKCVGDYKQATFRTNNSHKNKQYRDNKIKDFFVLQMGRKICHLSYDNTTRRFNQEICRFVNTIHADVDSPICSHSRNLSCEAENTGVYIIDEKYMEQYCNYYSPTILTYQRGSKISFYHDCQVLNYGNSKGCTFDRVVIIPVSTVLPFIKEQKLISSNQTRAKFFVACTRAKHSIIFAVNNASENDLFKPTEIILGGIVLPAYKYQFA